MESNNEELQIRREVLARIASGRTHVRSRVYFVARVALTALTALIALALSTFVLSFIVFSLHESGEQFLLGFGASGVLAFLQLFPWIPLAIDLLLLVLLEWLLQGFRFGYRFSLVTVFLAVFVASALLAFALNLTPVHPALLSDADHHDLPVIGPMYENIRGSHAGQGVYRGTVGSSSPHEFILGHDDGDHDEDDGTWTVIPPAGSPPPPPGSRVFVFGTAHGTTIQAAGIQPLSPDQ